VLSVAEARARVLDGIAPLPSEWVPLSRARGRVLAEDLRARLTQPPFDTTSMDGYAVRAADTGPDERLTVIGESAAGKAFAGRIGPGEAARIFTGAPLPAGADAVVMQEDVTVSNGAITLSGPAAPGKHLRPAGLDFRLGDVGLRAGRVLDPRALALAAAMDHALLPVRRRPRVAVLATGDELVRPGAPRGADAIVLSSLYSVAALVEELGGEALDLGIAPDDTDAIAARLVAARDAGSDVIVTLGGASAGDRDLVKPVFAAIGVAPGFWKIAMRPGKPLVHGRLATTTVLGLPGNPVSAYACAVLFLAPLLRALLGRPTEPRVETGVLAVPLPANDAREDYLRARLSEDGAGPALLAPFPRQDSSMQAVLARADAFVVRAPRAPAADAGSSCDFIRF
jgi:molybdopterin molybdotransferase